MGKYTRKGSADLDARIDADLRRIAHAVAPISRAGILLGGYGRGEGTPFIHPDGSQAPFNDYDLMVIVDRADSTVRAQLRSLESRLSAELDLPVDLCPCVAARLSKCEFSLLNCEMQHGHRVVWGDAHILDAMPDMPVDQIPRSEGARLLLNRGKLLLDIKQRLAKPEPLTEEETIRFLKFIGKVWLALGDCALLAERKYDLSYAVKLDRIDSIGDIPDRDTIIDHYTEAIALKEWGDYHTYLDSDIAAAFRDARDLFLDFLPWYRKRFCSKECSASQAMLLNLAWFRWPYLAHPRERLYDALLELLQDDPDYILLGQILACSRDFEQRFYSLQARFS